MLSGIDVPEINEEQSKVYNSALISWHHPDKDKADSYVLEYRKIDRDEDLSWSELQVCGTSKVVSDLEDNSLYAFRVRAYKGSICSPCSRELILHTPPAPGTGPKVEKRLLLCEDQYRKVVSVPSWDLEMTWIVECYPVGWEQD